MLNVVSKCAQSDIHVRNKIAYLLLSKTMTGKLSVRIVHSNVQTRAALVCIMSDMLMLIISDSQQSCVMLVSR